MKQAFNRLVAAATVKRLAKATTATGAIVALFAFFDWHHVEKIAQTHDAVFKIVGQVFGPILALAGFFWGLSEREEVAKVNKEIGAANHEMGVKRAELTDKEDKLSAAKHEIDQKSARIDKLESDLETVADSSRLWKLRPNAPFPEYRAWKYDPDGAKIVTVGLFKGGVGKTHLASNFAAYVSERKQKPVLLIDLDYQGSLSTTMILDAGLEQDGSKIDALFAENADLATFTTQRVHLAAKGLEATLNGGKGLSRAWIVPADYTLTQVESKLTVERLIRNRPALDERYRLAHVLLDPQVRRQFAMIIIDTPPRMTLGTINAFVASHSYVVPTILDRVSTEALRPFLRQIKDMKEGLALDCELAGIVGTMTRTISLSAAEQQYRDLAEQTARAILGTPLDPMILQNLPRRAQITNNNDLGYFLRDGEAPMKDRFYDAIFDELWTRIMSPPNQDMS